VIGGFLLLSQPSWGTQTSEPTLSGLPGELQEKIINFTEIAELLNLARVNKAYYDSVKKALAGRSVVIKTEQLNDDTVESLKHVGDLNLRFDPNTNDATLRLIGKLTNLKHLYLRGTKITDAGLAQLKNLQNLTYLNLNDNNIGDAGLDHLKDLKNLEQLALNSRQITDVGLANLRGISKLRSLWLGKYVPVSDAAVDELKKAIPGLEVQSF
jgi:Leucine-rich repeat (LRR) protein